jgi:hypothetical protein
MALLLLAVLWWPETEAGGGVADLSLDLGGLDLFLSPLSHHGGGLEERFHDEVVVVVSMEGHPGVVVLPRANHMANKFVAMICGKKGDPSSTSVQEALWFFFWGSTPMESQVVRPQTSTGCQQTDLCAGSSF